MYTLRTKIIKYPFSIVEMVYEDFGSYKYIDSIKCVRYNDAKKIIIDTKMKKIEEAKSKKETKYKINSKKN